MSVTYFTDRDLGKQFPGILRNAGLTVERHDDHFSPQTPDDEWLKVIGKRGWIAISHDQRIRYRRNERDSVIRHHVALFLVVGKAPFPELARAFIASVPGVERLLERHRPPFIAKVYRGPASDDFEAPYRPGRVELWYPPPRNEGVHS